MTGCLEKAPQLSATPSAMPQDQPVNHRLQMDFDAELRSDLFSVRCDLMHPGNSSLAYLMLNATMRRGEREEFCTEYLLMQIEPNRDYSFEISKNVRITAGEYECTLKAMGPQGVLAEKSRRIILAESRPEMAFEPFPWPVELDEKVSRQEMKEERPREESLSPKEIPSAPEEMGDKKSLERGSANEGAFLQASPTLPNEAKAEFIGSINSKKYHRLDCRYAVKIKPDNRINFQSREDAKRQGYLPCRSCNP